MPLHTDSVEPILKYRQRVLITDGDYNGEKALYMGPHAWSKIDMWKDRHWLKMINGLRKDREVALRPDQFTPVNKFNKRKKVVGSW